MVLRTNWIHPLNKSNFPGPLPVSCFCLTNKLVQTLWNVLTFLGLKSSFYCQQKQSKILVMYLGWIWWYTLGSTWEIEADDQEFKAILSYILSLMLAWDTRDPFLPPAPPMHVQDARCYPLCCFHSKSQRGTTSSHFRIRSWCFYLCVFWCWWALPTSLPHCSGEECMPGNWILSSI